MRHSILVPGFLLLFFYALFMPHRGDAQIIGQPMALSQTTTIESSHIFKPTGGYLYSLSATTSAAGYVLLYDATAVPSNGTVTPQGCYAVAANSTNVIMFGYPFPFLNGIIAAFSSTGCFTQTLANAFFAAQVR